MSVDIFSFAYGILMAVAFWGLIFIYHALKTSKENQKALQNHMDALNELKEKPNFVKIAEEVMKEATQ